MLPKDLKYKIQILKLLFKYGALSGIEIGKKIDKSLSHVVKNLEDLTNLGYITISGYAPSNGGRRALMYQLKEKELFIIGVGVNRYSTHISLYDIASQDPVQENIIKYEIQVHQESLHYINLEVAKFIGQLNIEKNRILGIGIGMPGFIDIDKDQNLTFNWNNITSEIHKLTSIPAFADNDSSCVALAVQNFGEAKNISSAMVINISWGIGLGMILDHKIYRGDRGFAGEFSHVPIFHNNKLCSCGKVGCLETETSIEYIINKIVEDIRQNRPSILSETLNGELNHDFEALKEALKHGDFLAVESISKAAYKIGQGISFLIHILNPQKIILSGQGALYGDIWKPPIQQALNEFCIKKLVEDVELEISELNIHSEVLGAASLVIENINKIPHIEKLIQLQILHN